MTCGADSGFFLQLFQELCSAFLLCGEADLSCCCFEGFGSVTSALSLLSSGNCCRYGLQLLTVVAAPEVAAEVLFLRKQLAYYEDHQIRPRRLTDAARLALAFASMWMRLRRAKSTRNRIMPPLPTPHSEFSDPACFTCCRDLPVPLSLCLRPRFVGRLGRCGVNFRTTNS